MLSLIALNSCCNIKLSSALGCLHFDNPSNQSLFEISEGKAKLEFYVLDGRVSEVLYKWNRVYHDLF